MELRETCCLVDHSLIVKGNKLRNSRWRGIHRTGCVWGRHRTSRSPSLTFPKSACVPQARSCPDPVWGFLWRSHHTSTIDSVTGCCDCFNQKRFGLSQTWSGEGWGRGGTGNSNLLTMCLDTLEGSAPLWKGGTL